MSQCAACVTLGDVTPLGQHINAPFVMCVERDRLAHRDHHYGRVEAYDQRTSAVITVYVRWEGQYQ